MSMWGRSSREAQEHELQMLHTTTGTQSASHRVWHPRPEGASIFKWSYGRQPGAVAHASPSRQKDAADRSCPTRAFAATAALSFTIP